MGRDERGYTLAELIMVMMVFTVVTGLIALSFNRIVSSSGQVIKSAETDIGGLIGLELFRSDLEVAGFGLPYSVTGSPSYDEIQRGALEVNGIDAADFNDKPPDAPRAFASLSDKGYNRSDYLVLKGTPLGMSATCRRWSYLSYHAGAAQIKTSKSEVELTPGKGDRVVVLRNSVTGTGVVNRELVTDAPQGGSAVFYLVFNTPFSDNFKPRDENEVHLLYGVAPKNTDGADQSLVFPYNRADYYLSNPRDNRKNAVCAKNTGMLYKAVMSQNAVQPKSYPLLDCVADLQVVFLMDTDGNGEVDRWVSDFSELNDLNFTAADIRDELVEVRVYILAQQGKRESSYSYPLEGLPLVVGDAALDKSVGKTLGSVWNESAFAALDPDWRHYRWKVYTIVVQPKNL